ncbi:MAG: ATP phosphoribosyltransferase [Hyphomicrobiaceae bacterium]|nr:ATP phosphoribosyltransferase [Hyphomicrobiaceae bacterium]
MTDATSERLILAVPSKGRLMDDTAALIAKGGLTLARTGNERGYRGELKGLPGVEVAFVSASEIADLLRKGEVHLGVTGEDLIRDLIPEAELEVELLKPLGFGHADVVVAVPDFWIDVSTMSDLEEAALLYRRRHGQRMRVATKYRTLTRMFFAGHRYGGSAASLDTVTMYRIVESLGATEGAPAAGLAELIVDITSTGSTLRANGLRILDDGIILKSEANLVMSRRATWSPVSERLKEAVLEAIGGRGKASA